MRANKAGFIAGTNYRLHSSIRRFFNALQSNDNNTQPIRLASLASDVDMTLSYVVQNQHNNLAKHPQITLTMLREVFDKIKDSEQNKIQILQEIADELNRIKDDKPMYVHYHLDSRARLEHFFAQCCVEVGGSAFNLEEKFNYTTANRLREVFDKFKNDSAKADELIALKSGRAKAIANYVYSDKNGNKGGDDGWDFRGRGIKQLTGRNNYAGFQSFYNANNPNNKKDFLNNEEYRKELITNGRVALLSAVWVWNTFKINKQKICDIANKQDFIHTNFKFTQYKNETGAHITLYNISENLSWITHQWLVW